MRVGGLASGMDIDGIVKDLMKAERMPLDKMEQDKTWLTWQRDAYRDVNKQLLELDNLTLDMKLQRTFNSKSTSSSQEDAVTAIANTSASAGSYNVEVKQLASSAINVSQKGITAEGEAFDPNQRLGDAGAHLKNGGGIQFDTDYEFFTYDEEGNEQRHTFQVSQDQSLNDVLKGITTADNGVRAFYDRQADKVVLERTETGDFNKSDTFLGAEIGFDSTTNSGFFVDVLQIKNGVQQSDGSWAKAEQGGKNVQFTYNGALELESFENTYSMNGVTFNFNNVTSGQAKINVTSDIEGSMEKITDFVDKYNGIIENLNEKVSERRNRDYKPLTEKQREGMEEREIELWEEQAKKGMLSGEAAIRGALSEMRNNWYSTVEGTGAYNQLAQIGITTSPNYRDGGKLLIDEDKLRTALRDDPDSVHQLFAKSGEGAEKGIVRRLEDTLDRTVKSIERKAGKSTSLDNNFALGNQLKDINSRMLAFQDRLVQVEERYWKQFTEMEKAIQKMNSQSTYMMQQFGGGF
ncbi:flagellar hook-associated protein 2 [Thalassobacillus devorans]|uniref:Flagellar hook-associated protein 2 n=1 Tax=Thalassobacillus devorans TaxID=279813 RepID=A0ABQ1NQJ9_9BACI|nr:flagellar hook-associated protein 2 [Thalassobacillus devorans]NIK28868.1 flagellar hook-associated protein 2 [Thalassobacillus devorans]GGC82986.1 flagellar hook-associated protein 2 [Thalassobacillus devorans]